MNSRPELSPPLRPLSSTESSYSDSSDRYPARGRERWRSEGARSHHRSHPHRSYRKKRRESGSQDRNHSRHRCHRRRKESRKTATALRISGSSRSSRSRASSPGTSGDETRAGGKPQTDWLCGVCSNLNSAQRSDCYRCEASYAQSRRAKPSTEVSIQGVPESCTSQHLEVALKDAFVRHGERLDVSIGIEKHASVWCVRFPSIFESTKALIFCHCRLLLEGAICRMEFSKESKGEASAHATLSQQQASHELGAPSNTIEQLPFELQPSHWKSPSGFSSIKARKDYLEMLSVHWQYLSEPQKVYYDEEVKKVLLTPNANSQDVDRERTEHLEVSSTKKDSDVTPETSANSIEALRCKLEQKKKLLNRKTSGQHLPNDQNSSESSKATTTTDTILQLKQRLAQKKAQIAADGRHSRSSNANPNDPDTNITQDKANNTSNEKTCSSEGVGPSVIQPLRYIHGFPIPPLYNLEKSLSNSTIVFHCIPSAVASRVLPLSLVNVLGDDN